MEKLLKCVYSRGPDMCSDCEDGYFSSIDGKCQKCHPGCLTCQSASEESCTSCGFKKFRLNLNGPESKIWYSPSYKCLDSCDVSFKGKSYKAGDSSNLCIEKKEEESH
jgi:hypothetical protein